MNKHHYYDYTYYKSYEIPDKIIGKIDKYQTMLERLKEYFNVSIILCCTKCETFYKEVNCNIDRHFKYILIIKVPYKKGVSFIDQVTLIKKVFKNYNNRTKEYIHDDLNDTCNKVDKSTQTDGNLLVKELLTFIKSSINIIDDLNTS